MEYPVYRSAFTEIQEEIKAKAPEAYLMTLTRRFMMRITDRIREVRKGLVIINGESLGQVASQTLESMQAINAVTNTRRSLPVYGTLSLCSRIFR